MTLRVRVRDLQPGDIIRGRTVQTVVRDVKKQFPDEPPRVTIEFTSGLVSRWNPSTEVTVERGA